MKILWLILFFNVCNEGKSQNIIIKHINIVDVVNNKIHYNRNILIAGKTIKAISTNILRSNNAVTINGKGKFILPGLWDMHVHTVDSSYLAMFVINGVLGIRDMGGAARDANNGCESIHLEKLQAWRKLIQSELIIGPRMYLSGPAVSNTRWNTSINITTPDDARNAVNKLKHLNVDFIKVYEKIPPEAYQTLAQEATKSGLNIAGHVPETISLTQAAQAEQRSIEHIRDALLMCYTDDQQEILKFFKNDNWSASDIEWGLTQFKACPEVIKAFKANQTWLVPTLTVERSKVAVHESQFVNDDRRKKLPLSVQQGFKHYREKKLGLSTLDRKSDSLWWNKQKRFVKRMHEQGIQIMAGTDCACEGSLPGYSLHNELELLVEAGLTPFEALQTATIHPAKYFQMTDSLGTVEEGKIADLIIIDKNALKNISATQSIYAVILKGKLIREKQIKKLESTLKIH